MNCTIIALKNADEIPYIANLNGWHIFDKEQKELFIKGYRVCWQTQYGIFFAVSWHYALPNSNASIRGNGVNMERAEEFCAKNIEKFIAYVTNPANLKSV